MEKNQKFVIAGTNDKLWNFQELINYLARNQRQHISLKINPEAICLETLGVYQLLDNFEFKQVDVYTHNQLEKHNKYNIVIDQSNEFLTEDLDIPNTLHVWDQTKTFLNLYGRPTANRLGISAHLLNCHAEKSVIHFSFGNTYNDLPLYELEKLSQYDLDSVRKVSSLIVNMPIKQASTTGYCNQHYNFHDTLTQLYQHVFVDIVSESHVLGDTFFPTEKTTRPMWLKKPFIVFASKNYLDYLHQMEFRTFSDFWSEEYDGFEGKDRFNKILKLIDSIALKSTDELEKMYWDMQYTLNHNYNLLLTQTYKKEITYIP